MVGKPVTARSLPQAARKVASVLLAVIALITFPAAASEPVPCDCIDAIVELIQNGTFDGTTLAHWQSYAKSGNSVALDAANHRAKVVVGAVGASYEANLSQTVGCVTPSTVYTLSFRSWASQAGRPVSVQIAVVSSTGAFVRLIDTATLTLGSTAGALHGLTFHMPENLACELVQVSFNYGAQKATYYLDDVSLKRTDLKVASTSPAFTFDATEGWFEGATGQGKIQVLEGSSSGVVAVTVPADQGRFLYRYQPLDLSAGKFLLKLKLSTTTSKNVARIYVTLRSPAWGGVDQYIVASRSGLVDGSSTVTISSTRNDPNLITNTSNGFLQYASLQHYSPAEVFAIGVKVEANSNGPATVSLDQITIVPYTDPNVDVDAAADTVISRVSIATQPTAATFTWLSNLTGTSKVEWGTTSSYGNLLAAGAAPGGYTATMTGLTADTLYHARVSTGTTGRSGDIVFRTEPVQPWCAPSAASDLSISLDLSGDTTDEADLAAAAGFNRVLATFRGGCDGTRAERDSSTGLPLTCTDEPVENSSSFKGLAKQFFRRAEELGMQVIPQPFCSVCVFEQNGAGAVGPPMATLDSHVASRIDFLRDYPAVIGYYIWDEPEGSDPTGTVIGPRLAEVNRVIDEAEANHVPFVDPLPSLAGTFRINEPGYPQVYLDAVDRPVYDFYPVPFAPAESIADRVRAGVTRAAASGKPLEFVFQASQWELDKHWPTAVDNGASRFPTRSEMRTMAYEALIQGADNLSVFSGIDLWTHPGTDWHWSDVSSVVHELRRLGPALVSTEAPPASCATVTISGTGAKVDKMLASYRGRVYLVTTHRAVGTVSGSPKMTVTLGSGCVGPVQVLGEARAFSGSFQETFVAGATHVYKLFTSQRPDVKITSPLAGATVQPGSVPLAAYADDNKAVSSVEFLVDNVHIATDTTAPYAAAATISAGDHTVQAIARDANGNSATDSIPLHVAWSSVVGVLKGIDVGPGAIPGTGVVTGTATDPDSSNPVTVKALVDCTDPFVPGCVVAQATTTAGGAYQLQIPASFRDGLRHAVRVLAHDVDGHSADVILPGSPALFRAGTGPSTVGAVPLEGSVRYIGYLRVADSSGGTGPANMKAVMHHTSIVTISLTADPNEVVQKLAAARDLGFSATLDVTWMFFVRKSTSDPTPCPSGCDCIDSWCPRPEAEANALWTSLKNTIAPYTDSIVAYFLVDEPYWTSPKLDRTVMHDALQHYASRIKDDFPQSAVMTGFAWVTLHEGMTGGPSLQVPPAYDWVGFDCYGNFDSCGDATRHHSIPEYAQYLLGRLTPAQQMFLVPQAGTTPIYPEAQTYRYIDGMETLAYDPASPLYGRVVALLGFLWQTERLEQPWTGAQDLPGPRGRYQTLGLDHLPRVNRPALAGFLGAGVKISGWAVDPDTPTVPTDVEIRIDSVPFRVSADLQSEEIDRSLEIAGRHGFDWTVPSQYHDCLTHNVELYAFDTTTGTTGALLDSTCLAIAGAGVGRTQCYECP